MAKGDMGGGAANGTGVAPKTDQYSVMHKLMDGFGGQAQGSSMGSSIAPSQMPPMNPMSGLINGGASMGGGQMGSGQNSFLSGDQFNQQPLQPKPMGGNFHAPGVPMGNNWGITGGNMGGSLAPSNLQDMMRRAMTNNRTFGQ